MAAQVHYIVGQLIYTRCRYNQYARLHDEDLNVMVLVCLAHLQEGGYIDVFEHVLISILNEEGTLPEDIWLHALYFGVEYITMLALYTGGGLPAEYKNKFKTIRKHEWRGLKRELKRMCVAHGLVFTILNHV